MAQHTAKRMTALSVTDYHTGLSLGEYCWLLLFGNDQSLRVDVTDANP